MQIIYYPYDETDSILIKLVFESKGIPYFMGNDHFGSLYPGVVIGLYNEKYLMVDEQYKERGEYLIDAHRSRREDIIRDKCYSNWDRFRCVLDMILFGWFFPGTMHGKMSDRTRSEE